MLIELIIPGVGDDEPGPGAHVPAGGEQQVVARPGGVTDRPRVHYVASSHDDVSIRDTLEGQCHEMNNFLKVVKNFFTFCISAEGFYIFYIYGLEKYLLILEIFSVIPNKNPPPPPPPPPNKTGGNSKGNVNLHSSFEKADSQ